jgi:hypothetical protein
VQSNFRDIACSLFWVPLPSFYRWLGQEHGRTIPLAVIANRMDKSRFGPLDLPYYYDGSEGTKWPRRGSNAG